MSGLKRFSYSSAYIDSGAIGAFMAGVLGFSVWISLETSSLVSPLWLATSIVAVVVYQLSIFWLMRQYHEADRVFGIFTSNILCLSLVILTVELVSGVTLPNRLPVLSPIAHSFGYQVEAFSPGSVALSYAVIAIMVGLVAMLIMLAFERLPLYSRMIKLLRLDRLDLLIDYYLDRHSIWLDSHSFGWFVLPQILLVAVLVIVVGLAAVLM